MKKYSYTHYQSPEVYEREQSQGLRKIFEFDKTLKELEIKMSEKEINELWIELVRDMNEYFVGDENDVLTIRCEKKLNEKITQLNSLLTISRFVVKKLGLKSNKDILKKIMKCSMLEGLQKMVNGDFDHPPLLYTN